jgi:hypothetical protein
MNALLIILGLAIFALVVTLQALRFLQNYTNTVAIIPLGTVYITVFLFLRIAFLYSCIGSNEISNGRG